MFICKLRITLMLIMLLRAETLKLNKSYGHIVYSLQNLINSSPLVILSGQLPTFCDQNGIRHYFSVKNGTFEQKLNKHRVIFTCFLYIS